MAFQIDITITGDEKDYEAAVKKAQDETRKLGVEGESGARRGRESFDRWGASAVSLRGALSGVLTLMAGRQVISFASQFIDAASQVEQYRVRLTALSGSQEIANAQLARFTEIAATTPFELSKVVAAATTLEAFGANADKTLKPIADLAAFMGVDIPEAAAAFGRAFAGGAGAADILRERGVLTLVQLRSGIDDLTKLSLPQFRAALIEAMVDPAGRIKGTTDLLANTWVGAVSNMKDAWFQFQTAVASGGVLEFLTARIRDATRAMSALTTEFGIGFELANASGAQLQARLEVLTRRLEGLKSEQFGASFFKPLAEFLGGATQEELELKILDIRNVLTELGPGVAAFGDQGMKAFDGAAASAQRLNGELGTTVEELMRLGQISRLPGSRIDLGDIELFEGLPQVIEDANDALRRQSAIIQNTTEAEAEQRELLGEQAREAERLASGVTGIFAAAISGTLTAADLGRRALAGLANFAQDAVASILRSILAIGGGGGSVSSPQLSGVFGSVVSSALGIGGLGGGTIAGGIVSRIGSAINSALSGLGLGGFSLGPSLSLIGNAGPLAGTGLGVGGLGVGAGATGPLAGATSIPVVGLIIAAIANLVVSILDGTKKQLTGGGIGFLGNIFGASGLGNQAVVGLGAQPRNAAQATIQNLASAFIFPGAGILAGTIFNGLGIFGPRPDPTLRLGAGVGIGQDPTSGRINFGDISVEELKRQEIGGGFAEQIRQQVEAVLQDQATQFTNILGVFPRFVVDRIIPAIEESNRTLEALFARIGFSEQGPETIADELKRFTNRQAREGFFLGTRGVFGAAAAESITAAGLSRELADLATAQFPAAGDIDTIRQTGFRRLLRQQGGLQLPRRKRDIPAFIEALQGFAGLSAGVAQAGAFITGTDRELLEREFERVLGITEGTEFTQAATGLAERLNPVLEFVRQASEQSETLFARGISAAMEAANESNAKRAFLASFEQGIRSSVLTGLQEAFLSSGQFNEILAPVQKTIRAFVQESILTGEPPDLAAFRAEILPRVEEASATAVLLSELAPAFNDFRRILDDALRQGGLGGGGPNITIPVTIESISTDIDVEDLLQQVGDAVHQATTV